MIANVLTLIKTLLQILLLRKGPDALPRAPVRSTLLAGRPATNCRVLASTRCF